MPRFWIGVWIGFLWIALCAAPAGAASFAGLPFIDAWDVTPDGQTVAGGGAAPVLWTAGGGAVPLPLPTGTSSGAARALAADGSVAVGVASAPEQAVRWSGGSAAVLSPGPSFGLGVSADGSVAVGQASSAPVRWDAGSGASPLPGASLGLALGITPDGSRIVGQASIPGGFYEAVEWIGADMNELPNLGGGSAARAISGDASTIVGSVTPFGSGARQLAASWVGGVLSTLPLLPGTLEGDAWDVSGDGRVVVGFTGTSIFSGQRATLWDASGAHDIAQLLTAEGLDLSGWTLQEAYGISADGRTVVGDGRNPQGLARAWIAVIPEPSTGALLGVGISLLALARRGAVASR